MQTTNKGYIIEYSDSSYGMLVDGELGHTYDMQEATLFISTQAAYQVMPAHREDHMIVPAVKSTTTKVQPDSNHCVYMTDSGSYTCEEEGEYTQDLQQASVHLVSRSGHLPGFFRLGVERSTFIRKGMIQ